MTRTDYTSDYLPTFSFNQADLDTNRQGILSEDQFYIVEAVYQARQRGARQTYKLFAIWIPLLIIIGVVIEFTRSGKSVGEFLPNALPIVTVVGGGMGLVVLASAVFSSINGRDARDKRISVAEGEAQLVERSANARYSRSLRYELILSNGALKKDRFRFANPESIAHFEPGKTYRVYYIKYYPFPLMLSAEML